MSDGTSKPTVQLVLKNDSYELGRLAAAFDAFADRHNVGDKARFQLQLCLEEMVLNVINYGFDDDGEHEIHVDFEFRIDSKTVMVNILDDGRRFDPLKEVPEPDLDASLENRTVGGLGVHFVRRFMDDARYRHVEGRNRLTLTKNVES